ncbi:MAG: hypothetical protein AB1297_05555 [bacterium]
MQTIIQIKPVYRGVLLRINGRDGIFDCLGEVSKGEPLVGQIPLEDLDLVVDMTTRRLMHNSKSPDIPMAEIL